MAGSTKQEIVAVNSSHPSNLERLSPTNERTSFDGVTMAFHWATVALVLGLLTTAIWHAQSHDDVLKVLLLRIHRSLGVMVWITTVSRLVWRMTYAQLPPFPHDMTHSHRKLVQTKEYCLYALLVIQPLTGFGAVLTRGRSFTLFWGHVPPLIPHYPTIEVVLFSLHRIGAWSLGLLITAHAVKALVHHFMIRDNTLSRMAPFVGRRSGARGLSLDRDSQTSFGG